jgi:ATP-dependent helicase HrpA
MAAELVETSRLFARTVARVDPQWVEQAGAHLLVRTYSEPHWDAKRGAVMAYERATLYGLPIVVRRRVTYSSIDPTLSRELFLRHALVEDEWNAHHRFLEHNRRVLEQARSLEDKLRRRVVVDEEAVYAFYDARVPADVVSGRHFDVWWKGVRRDQPHLLDLDLRAVAPEPDDVDGFPDRLRVGGVELPLTYAFAPGEKHDGVTLHLPLTALNAVPSAALTWVVPGLRHERAVGLLKSLPKDLRRLLVPAPDTATAALREMRYDERVPFETALSQALRRVAAVDVPVSSFDVAKLPAHLRLHVSVRDGDGSVVGVGDDLDRLRTRLAPQLRQAVAGAAVSLQRRGLREWPGGTLPRTVELDRDGARVVGYPALVDEGSTVGVRVLPSAAEQAVAMPGGTRRLLLLTTPSPARGLLGALSARDKLALARDTDGHAAETVRDAITAAVDLVVADAGGPAWDEAGWQALRRSVESRLPESARGVLRQLMQLHALAHDLRERLRPAPPTAFAPAYDDLRTQLRDLVPDEVATVHGARRLPDVVRYLEGMRVRLDRLPQNVSRDLAAMDRVHAAEDAWHDAVDAVPPAVAVPPALLEVRWMLEELRVSLFAQQLGTAYPVSDKRVLQAVAAARP